MSTQNYTYEDMTWCIFISCVVAAHLAAIVCFWLRIRRHRSQPRNNATLPFCPFYEACTKYHQDHTADAAIRVIRLMLENMPTGDQKKKSALHEFLKEVLSWNQK